MSFEDSPADREWAPTEKEWDEFCAKKPIQDIATARDRLDLEENWYSCKSQRKADRIGTWAGWLTAAAIAIGSSIAAWKLWP